MDDDFIYEKDLSALLELFRNRFEYCVIDYSEIQSKLDRINADADICGLHCIIESIHVDMNGDAELFIINPDSGTGQGEIISVTKLFPPGHQSDYRATAVKNQLRVPVAYSTDFQIIYDNSYGPVDMEDLRQDERDAILIAAMNEYMNGNHPDLKPEHIAEDVIWNVKHYLQENYSYPEIISHGDYIYDVITQKVFDFCSEAAEKAVNVLSVGSADKEAVEVYRDVILTCISLDDFDEFIQSNTLFTAWDVLQTVMKVKGGNRF